MYEISKITDVGKVKKAEFVSGQKGVTFFSNWPGFADLKVGDKVVGDLARSDYNGKEGWIMNQLKKPSTFRAKPNEIKAAVKEKNEGIERAQIRKSENIQLSSSQRDAVLLVTSFYPEFANDPAKEQNIKVKITAWRIWLLDEFSNEQPPF